MKNQAAYPEARIWRELREACLERANKRCEFVHPNGQRCARTDGELRTSRHSGRKYIVYLHAAHSANACPDDPKPELICLCPAHHLKMDRQLEAQDRISQRRRGYRITTTDSLLVEIRDAGVEIEEKSGGYYWSLPSLGLGGHATTAARAAGCALYQLRLNFEKHKHTYASSAEGNLSMTISTYRQYETIQLQATSKQFTLSLHDLNELLGSLTAEHLPYLAGEVADWYGQIVPIVLLPNGLPALQANLNCLQCDESALTIYAIPGEHGAWATLLEADGSFLTDLCDADARNRALLCPECIARQAEIATSLKTGEACDGE